MKLEDKIKPLEKRIELLEAQKMFMFHIIQPMCQCQQLQLILNRIRGAFLQLLVN